MCACFMISEIVLAVCLIGLVYSQLPHGHELHQLIDSGFMSIDHNPTDGVVLEQEFDQRIFMIDADNDTCVTSAEYTSQRHSGTPVEVATKMFAHLDHDHDGCLKVSDMSDEFHLIDHNGDNQVTMHEFEQYYSHLLGKLFGHGHNGR